MRSYLHFLLCRLPLSESDTTGIGYLKIPFAFIGDRPDRSVDGKFAHWWMRKEHSIQTTPSLSLTTALVFDIACWPCEKRFIHPTAICQIHEWVHNYHHIRAVLMLSPERSPYRPSCRFAFTIELDSNGCSWDHEERLSDLAGVVSNAIEEFAAPL